MGSPRPPSTITHVVLSGIYGKGRIDWLKATFKSYMKMEGTKDRTHPFPQLTPYVIIRVYPSPPPNVYWTNTYFFSGGFAVKVSL